ncbi:DUF418 domain-containing protein [Sphaerisporangium sp. NPDC051017]
MLRGLALCGILRRYSQGPLEWLWRWATWTHCPPLRHPT